MGAEIKLKEAVLHILDSNVSMPVLSNQQLEITEEIETFLERHLTKILGDGNIQEAVFLGESGILKAMGDFRSRRYGLLETSHIVAEALFPIMQKNVDIPAADLVVCVFDCNNTENVGILKLNYRTGYSHYVSHTDTGVSNSIIRQKTMLPLENQKIEECAVISLDDFGLKVLQKEYEINGNREEYWSTLFLKCRSELSGNSKLKIIDKAAQKMARKYYDEDFSKVSQARTVISETLEETSAVKIDDLAQKVFDRNDEIRKEYIGELQKAGIRENYVPIPNDTAPRRITNQKIKTDTGIEINFPSHIFNDKSKIEFVNNADGTISILIKNVGKIQNK